MRMYCVWLIVLWLLLFLFGLAIACCAISSGRTVYGILSRMEYLYRYTGTNTQPLKWTGGRSNVSLFLCAPFFCVSIRRWSMCFTLDLSGKLIAIVIYIILQKASASLQKYVYSNTFNNHFVLLPSTTAKKRTRYQIKSAENTACVLHTRTLPFSNCEWIKRSMSKKNGASFRLMG